MPTYTVKRKNGEGEEWDVICSYKELQEILGKYLDLFKKKYQISEEGNFEGSNILVENSKINFEEHITKIKDLETRLLEVRRKRTKPFFGSTF